MEYFPTQIFNVKPDNTKKHHHIKLFLAARSSSGTTVVGWLVGWSVCPLMFVKKLKPTFLPTYDTKVTVVKFATFVTVVTKQLCDENLVTQIF